MTVFALPALLVLGLLPLLTLALVAVAATKLAPQLAPSSIRNR
jgi:hypothetical protein